MNSAHKREHVKFFALPSGSVPLTVAFFAQCLAHAAKSGATGEETCQ